MLGVSPTNIDVYAQARRARGLPVILDLGCGASKVPGALGMDIATLPGVDIVHDLGDRPYPVPEDFADMVYLNHVLEHCEDPVSILGEVWRVTRPNGQVFIRTPHYSGIYAWRDPTHRHAFSGESFRYFGENRFSYYSNARFRVTHLRLKYLMEEEYWRWTSRAWGRLVQWVLDRHPTFSERFLAHLVGGIDEIQATLTAVKPAQMSSDA